MTTLWLRKLQKDLCFIQTCMPFGSNNVFELIEIVKYSNMLYMFLKPDLQAALSKLLKPHPSPTKPLHNFSKKKLWIHLLQMCFMSVQGQENLQVACK